MLIRLRDEAGQTLEESFARDDMEGAAEYCMANPDYGITWFPEGGEEDWDEEAFIEVLESR